MNFNLKDFINNIIVKLNVKANSNLKSRPFATIIVTLLFAFGYFFMVLPAINLKSPSFYTFVFYITIVFALANAFLGGFRTKKVFGMSVLVVVLAVVIPLILSFFASPILHAKAYSNLIDVQSGVFEKDVARIKLGQIPIVDRETASILGSKQMGVMTDLVSQFEIDENYAQINIDGKPLRVSPLRYSDLIKYVYNFQNGIPNYVYVDMATQEANVKKLEKPLKYSNSDYLMRNIRRKIRFDYPFDMLGYTNFELDDNYNAYYVTPVLTKKVAFFRGTDVKAVIITNANTGESNKYNVGEVPNWVDRVYPSELIINQLDYYGEYKNGFFNSVFGQKNVTKTTDGYNYISIGKDIYLTTGVTSVRSDESNLGFYFVNLRTKETKFYALPSATEIAAMQSAKGKVQEKNYNPTFPVILNLNNKPVYFIALKDNSKTAKLFALVDAKQFNNVFIGSSVDQVVKKYLKLDNTDNLISDRSIKKKITISEKAEITYEGYTMYYLKVKEDNKVYIASVKELGAKIAFVKVGDTIDILGNESEKGFIILDIE